MDGDFKGSTEIKRNVGNGSEAIEIAEPFLRAAARAVASECGVNVAIRKDEIVALKKGHDLAFAAVCKIGGVEQRECSWREKATLFTAARGGFDEWRRVPFGEVKAIAADFEPAF